MRINFKQIEVENFMSFKHQTFDFSALTGLSLIQGKNNDVPGQKNGTGKSQMWLSLLYVLFGQLQGKIRNENLINKYVKERDMNLALDLSVDGVDYRIKRGILKGKNSYLEVFQLVDGQEVDVTKSTIPETQDYIEKEIIHCDITIFLRTILLSADQMYNFYLLKKADKKEFVEKLFDISVFEDMYKLIHKDCLTTDKESTSCQNRIMMLNKNSEDYKSRQDSYEEQRLSKAKSIEDLLDALKKKYEDTKQTEVKTNSDAISKLESALEKLTSDYDNNIDEIRSIQTKQSQISLGIHKLDESKESKNKIIEKHKDILAKLCDDCKPIFMKHYNLDVLSEEIVGIDKKKMALLEAKSKVDATYDQSSSTRTMLKAKIDKAQAKLRELIDESTKTSRELARIESDIESTSQNLNKVKSEKNPYDDLLAKCNDDLLVEQENFKKFNCKLKYLKFAENIVSQDTLRKFIIKDLVVLLNNKIKTYLTKLGAKFYVEFNEDMDYEFLTNNGETYEWMNFSMGERMRILIATSFAFRDFMSIRNGLNANILILDEYFDTALDASSLESILAILRGYSVKQNQNIFIVSHRQELNIEQFDRIIQVEKTNDIANINYL